MYRENIASDIHKVIWLKYTTIHDYQHKLCTVWGLNWVPGIGIFLSSLGNYDT